MQESLHHETVSIADDQLVRDYANDLRDLLVKSSITEQRGFLHSFVEKIEVNYSEVSMHHTIPLPPDSSKEETVGVLPIIHHGTSGKRVRFYLLLAMQSKFLRIGEAGF